MRYFLTIYECLDARDDYSAKRDKENGEGISYSWATSETLASLDNAYHDENVLASGLILDTVDDKCELTVLRRRGKSLREGMASAEHIMQMAGWLDDCTDGLPDTGSLKHILPDIEQFGKKRRALELSV